MRTIYSNIKEIFELKSLKCSSLIVRLFCSSLNTENLNHNVLLCSCFQQSAEHLIHVFDIYKNEAIPKFRNRAK